MTLPAVTVIGRLTSDPELRWTASGLAVANFTIASNDRRKNAAGEWEDSPATFLRCSIWRNIAENAAESLHRGDEVIAVGRLKERSFETKTGEKRSVMELDLEAIGPSLRTAPVKVVKADRVKAAPSAAAADPWATEPQSWVPAPGNYDTPPF